MTLLPKLAHSNFMLAGKYDAKRVRVVTKRRGSLYLAAFSVVPIAALWATLVLAEPKLQLEADLTAATLTVTETADTEDGVCNADCSLREAIEAAAPGDSVKISAGTYTLTLGSELAISKRLTLTGAGSGDIIIQAAISSADATSRVFKIALGQVTLSGVTVRHGAVSHDNAEGGGIQTIGRLTLVDSAVIGNTAKSGGGIPNAGTLTLTNSKVSDNAARGASGGDIRNTGKLTLTNSTISSNTAGRGGVLVQ